MISPARTLCYRLLNRIESQRVFSDDALNSEAMLRLELRDRHLTTEIVYGTLRWQAMLDYILGAAISRPWDEVAPGARTLLRLSLYQMWQMDRIPEYAIVNDAVELAKKNLGKGIDGFVNGVLRRLARTHPWEKKEFAQNAPPWIRASLPKWLWDRWAVRFGEKIAMDFALSLNSPPQAAMRFSGEDRNQEPLHSGMTKSNLVPGAYLKDADADFPVMEDRNAAACQFQDEASQLIPHLLKPLPGWKIWDACAAPGGKSAILSGLCGGSGRVVASDLRKERIRKMRLFLANAGAANTNLVVADAAAPPPFIHGFDAVLVDVPCSGLGTLRRNPEIKWNFKPQEFAKLQETQRRILHSASQAVRIGGRLLYSTCSTEPEENENAIHAFLNSHRCFSLTRPDYPPGIDNWTAQDGMVRTFPGIYRWDGFFAALMTRDS